MLSSTLLSNQAWLWTPELPVSIPPNTGIASVGYHAWLKMTFQGDKYLDRGATCWQCFWKVLFSDIDIPSQPRPEYKPASESSLVSFHSRLYITWTLFSSCASFPNTPQASKPCSSSKLYQWFIFPNLRPCSLWFKKKIFILFWN